MSEIDRQLSARDANRENQAMRIRWLLERADAATRMEFMLLAMEHPFMEEETDAGS